MTILGRRLAALDRAKVSLVASLFAMMFFLGVVNGVRGVCLPLMKEQFGAGYDAQGFMIFLSSLAGMGSSFVAAWLLRRFGVKLHLACCMMLVAGSMLALSFSPVYGVMVVLYTLLTASSSLYETGKNAMAAIVFTAKIAAKMILLHLFYGLGNILGPMLTELCFTQLGFTWRGMFQLLTPVAVALGLWVALSRYQLVGGGGRKDAQGSQLTLAACFKQPVVWLCAVTTCLGSVVEGGFGNWSLLHLQDVYGLDPVTAGASFMALFYTAFSLSRLLSGVLLEKVGYMRSLIIAAAVAVALFAAGFALGERGVWLLPLTGVCIALFWPTMLSVMIQAFGKDSALMSNAGMLVSAPLGALVQWGIGLINQYVGVAWGFRSLTVFAALYLVMLLVTRCALPQAGEIATEAET